MFDPLSALACIGFATGTLSFLVNTLSRIDERIDEIKECGSRLLAYKLQLEEGRHKIDTWLRAWRGRHAFDDEVYRFFWGSPAFEEIQIRIQEIAKLSKQIDVLLRNPSGLEKAHSIEWDQLLGRSSVENGDSVFSECPSKPSLFQAVSFSLFQNAALQEKIGRFKDQVQGLESVSRSAFRQEQDSDSNAEVSRSELLNLSRAKAFIDGLSSFASSIYISQMSTSQTTQWALELGPPEIEEVSKPWEEPDIIYIDFLVRSTFYDGLPRARRFRVIMPEEYAQIMNTSASTFRKICEILSDDSEVKLDTGPDQKLSLLEEPKSRSRPFRKMLTGNIFMSATRKSFDIERADLAYGMAHWCVLMWKTSWSSNMCTCGIRCIRLVNSGTRHAFNHETGKPHWDPPCHPTRLASEKLLLLGVALAEVGLAKPISVKVQVDGQPQFRLESDVVTRKQLVDLLRKQFGRDNICKAVRYCLDYEIHKPQGDFRPETFEAYRQNILVP